MRDLNGVELIVNRIEAKLFGNTIYIHVKQDKLHSPGRIYIQCSYSALCSKDGLVKVWRGRKWYLSEFMTDDEVVKTAFAAVKAAVEHEVMEAFKVDGKVLFNPHVNFESLLSITDQEVKRTDDKKGGQS